MPSSGSTWEKTRLQIPSKARLALLPPFLRNHPDRPRPLKPSAEECFRRSLKLAPDRLDAHEGLFEHFLQENKLDRAEEAGRALLEHFPDHAPTLERLGDLYVSDRKAAEGLELLERALRVNALSRPLRGRVGEAHMLCGRAKALAGDIEEARRHYQAALALETGKAAASILCRWAAAEFKSGEAERAEDCCGRRGRRGKRNWPSPSRWPRRLAG